MSVEQFVPGKLYKNTRENWVVLVLELLPEYSLPGLPMCTVIINHGFVWKMTMVPKFWEELAT